jgi:hypothetical protein
MRSNKALRRFAALLAVIVMALVGWRLARGARHTGDERVRSGRDAKGSGFRPWEDLTEHAQNDARNWSISGAVRTKDEALPGVTVCALCFDCEASLWHAPVCTESDAAGNYVIAQLGPHLYQVSASARGFLPAVVGEGRPLDLRKKDLEGQDLALEAGGFEVAGVVTDATGGVIAGASVTAMLGGTYYTARQHGMQSTISDQNGAFTLFVTGGEVGLVGDADGYAQGGTTVHAPAHEVRLQLTPESRISGVVVLHPEGTPVAGVRVRARSPTCEGKPGTSDGDGAFTVSSLRPGIYELEASGPGFLTQNAGSVLVDLNEHVDDVKVVVTRGVRVTGTIRVGEAPCEAGTAYLMSASMPKPLITYTTRPGEVEFEAVPPGHYQTVASCEGYEETAPFMVDVEDEDVSDVDWKVEAGNLVTLHSRTAEGKPVPLAWLELVRNGDKASAAAGTASEPRIIQSDQQGDAQLRGVPEGSYSIRGIDVEKPLAVTVGKGNNDFTVTLKALGAIQVVVKDRNGQPNDEVMLSAEPRDRAGRRAEFGVKRGAGRYYIGPLVAGEYMVEVRDRVNPSERAGGPQEWTTVRSGEEPVVQLSYGGFRGQIAGKVVDGEGNPRPDAWVAATPVAERHDSYQEMLPSDGYRVLTDGQGHFTLERLKEDGTFTVAASHSLGGEARVSGVKVGQELTITLRSPGRIAGKVLATEGKVPRHFQIVVQNKESGQQLWQRFAPDAEGRWSLDHVAPGNIEISAHSPEGVAKTLQSLAPGQQLEGVELTLAPAPVAQTP